MAPYVGNTAGAVLNDLAGECSLVRSILGPTPNWGEIEALLLESYCNIAPKKLVKDLMNKPGARRKPSKSGNSTR